MQLGLLGSHHIGPFFEGELASQPNAGAMFPNSPRLSRHHRRTHKTASHRTPSLPYYSPPKATLCCSAPPTATSCMVLGPSRMEGARTEDAARHAVRIERLQRLHLLADTHKLDGLPRDLLHTQSRPSPMHVHQQQPGFVISTRYRQHVSCTSTLPFPNTFAASQPKRAPPQATAFRTQPGPPTHTCKGSVGGTPSHAGVSSSTTARDRQVRRQGLAKPLGHAAKPSTSGVVGRGLSAGIGVRAF
jgi:hypothetical protein